MGPRLPAASDDGAGWSVAAARADRSGPLGRDQLFPNTHGTVFVAPQPSTANRPFAAPEAGVPAGVLVYEINGPFFFGAAEKFKETIIELRRAPKVRVIRMPERACHRLPEDDLVGNIDDALNVARAHLGLSLVARAPFAIPTVAREDRRRQPRPPG